MSKEEILRQLFTKYNLFYDASNPDSKDNDVYIHKHYKIITRTGIQKIEKQSGIKCTISIASSGKDYCNVIGQGYMPGSQIADYQTLASANELSVKSGGGYFCEMAEKRCRSRLILTLAGLYEYGVFGEDEAESFSDQIQQRQAGPPPVSYKGR